MAYDKLVDSTQLDADLTSVANAIRTKGGTSAALAFPAEFVSAIEDIETGGGELYYSAVGAPYMASMEMPQLVQGLNGLYRNAGELVSIVCNDTRKVGGYGSTITEMFYGCRKLESVTMPYLQGIANSYADRVFGNCTSLKTASFGSIGYPITGFSNNGANYRVFKDCTQNDLVITLFVDAADIASIPTDVINAAPWGATNATVVYRNSTTGEVLTA